MSHFRISKNQIFKLTFLHLNLIETRCRENDSFRDSDLLSFTQCWVAWYFTQHTSFYLTCNWHEFYYSPTFFRLHVPFTDRLISYWSCVIWWDTKIVGDVTLFSHLSDITCCHRAILSPIESSLGLFYNLIILLSKNVLQIKMRICLISENY